MIVTITSRGTAVQRAAAVSTLNRRQVNSNLALRWFSQLLPVKADAPMLADDARVINGPWFCHSVKLGQPGIGNVVSQQGVRPGSQTTNEAAA